MPWFDRYAARNMEPVILRNLKARGSTLVDTCLIEETILNLLGTVWFPNDKRSSPISYPSFKERLVHASKQFTHAVLTYLSSESANVVAPYLETVSTLNVLHIH